METNGQDFYGMFGFSGKSDFSKEELRSRYHTLVKLLHPDLYSTESEIKIATERISKLNRAYQYLSDQIKSDHQIIDQIKTQCSRDIQVKIKISLKDCILGSTKIFSIPNIVCENCNGSGCQNCGSSGFIKTKEIFSLTVPKGVKTGQKVVLEGSGIKGTNKTPGNLIVVFDVPNSDKIFSRSNKNQYDLKTTVWVNPLISVFGGEIKVPTPYGMETILVPKGISNNHKIDLKDQGIKPNGNLEITLVFDNFVGLKDSTLDLLSRANQEIRPENLEHQKTLETNFLQWL